jgi:hypothetical protein
MYDDVAVEWKRLTGMALDWSSVPENEMLSRQVATKGAGVDVVHPSSSPAAFQAAGVVQPVYADQLAWYDANSLAPAWTDPANNMGIDISKENAAYLAKSIVDGMVWWPGKKGSAFMMLPRINNMDAMCFLPEFIDTDIHSWGSMFDRQYKGKTSLYDYYIQSILNTVLYLVASGQMAKPEVGNNDLLPNEVDTAIDYLIAQKKAGQFKAFWADYGSCVTFHVGRDVWISDGWMPVEFDVRRGAVPCYYSTPDEGYRGWYSGDMPSYALKGDRLAAVYGLINWLTFAGWNARFVVRNGYMVSTYKSERVKQAFEAEYYDWQYGGLKSYLPYDQVMSEVWPDHPEFAKLPYRLANALFVPERKKWSTTSGTPDPNGVARDGGDVERHWGAIGGWQAWPAHADYYATAWDRMKSA